MLSCLVAIAQNDDKGEPKRVDFYGYVVTADSLRPIRNTHVISKMAHSIMIVNKGASARIVVEMLSGMCAIALYVNSQLPPTITDFIIKKK